MTVASPSLLKNALRFGERHVDEARIELRHADLEDRGHGIALDARGDAERGLRPLGREHRDLVADAQRQRFGEALADREPAGRIEIVERPLHDVAFDAGQLPQVVAPDAPDESAGLVVGRGDRRRALDHRNDQLDPRHLGDAAVDGVEIGQRGLDTLQEDVAVDADDLVEQFVPEAVHHGHDDDQGRHADADAEERETRDLRDEGARPAAAQIAQRHDPLEGREGPRDRPAPRPVASRRPSAVTARTRPWRRRGGRPPPRCTRLTRSPERRCLYSTLPSARPLGPTMIWCGRPMRSMAANLAPGRSSRSSTSVSRPRAVSARSSCRRRRRRSRRRRP